ncbi:hypothetical protein [Sorangium sp. So ce388]|uniref:hypothetical protein n=1 Tax=Sorangium sp. So ce388 TaxID=3133309 RepID=UPI003F5BFA75
MSQLGLFGDAHPARSSPAAPPAPPTVSAAVLPALPVASAARQAPPPVLDEHIAYHEAGTVAASYSVTVRNPFFGDWIHGGLWVRVERQLGWKPVRYLASVSLELPDEHRTWWGEHAQFATQDEAAEEAAAMLLAGRALLEASLCGEAVETPGARRKRAAEAHADAAPAVQAAARTVAEALELRRAIGAFNDGHPAAHSRYLVAKQEHESVRQRATDAFWRAHGWREFVSNRCAPAADLGVLVCEDDGL